MDNIVARPILLTAFRSIMSTRVFESVLARGRVPFSVNRGRNDIHIVFNNNFATSRVCISGDSFRGTRTLCGRFVRGRPRFRNRFVFSSRRARWVDFLNGVFSGGRGTSSGSPIVITSVLSGSLDKVCRSVLGRGDVPFVYHRRNTNNCLGIMANKLKVDSGVCMDGRGCTGTGRLCSLCIRRDRDGRVSSDRRRVWYLLV